MNTLHYSPQPNASWRRVPLSDALSSTSMSGLGVGDVLKSGLVNDQDVSRSVTAPRKPSLEESIYDALAKAKIWTSRVAMRMERAARDRYFRQLDRLHDHEEWIDEQKPVDLTSYSNFIRFMLIVGGDSKPSLGLSPVGELIALWRNGEDRLTIEFSMSGHLEWVVYRKIEDDVERAAGSTSLIRIRENLKPYQPERWFHLG